MLKERMALAKELWAAGLRALFLQAANPHMKDHYEFASVHHIPWLAVLEKSTFAAAETVKVRGVEDISSLLHPCPPCKFLAQYFMPPEFLKVLLGKTMVICTIRACYCLFGVKMCLRNHFGGKEGGGFRRRCCTGLLI
jgi:hypothetical protein